MKKSELVCLSYVTVPAYEGNSPFIYVYCAEEDTRLALPVLARLYNEGLRMWSWNGCENPTDVRASQRIASCAALLIFLSENLDRDIKREYFEAMEALRCNKVKYFVRLSDVELPFDWGKSDANVVIDYARSDEAKFWLSIYDSDIIESCRGAWPAKKVNVGLSEFESIDSGELSAEYSDIIKIIGTSPALDRSGVPINAEDIALFASVGDRESADESRAAAPTVPPVDELNSRSMADLFDMLDEISVSTRQKSDELRAAAEKRRADRERAAMSAASLPFQHDAVSVEYTDEPPVPELSFMSSTVTVESMAAEMFGLDSSELEPIETVADEPAEEAPAVQITSAESVEAEQESTDEPTFEEFIDGLIADKASETETPAELEPVSEPEPVHMTTAPITVEITDEASEKLLPPAVESLTEFTLPDDEYMATQFVVNDDETDPLPTAAERAAAEEESRRQFENALERAAYTVTGRIVARHSKGLHSVGLKVRKPKTVKLAVRKRTAADETAGAEKEPVKVTPVAVESQRHVEESVAGSEPSRRERRRSRRKEKAVNVAEESTDGRRVTVIPEPMRGEMPVISTPAEASQTETVTAYAVENVENSDASSPRKRRHPHNSSGLLDILRTMRRENTGAQSDEQNIEG